VWGDGEAYIGFRDAIDAVAVADVALSKRTLELAIATDVVVREVGVQNKTARSERLSLLSGRIACNRSQP